MTKKKRKFQRLMPAGRNGINSVSRTTNKITLRKDVKSEGRSPTRSLNFSLPMKVANGFGWEFNMPFHMDINDPENPEFLCIRPVADHPVADKEVGRPKLHKDGGSTSRGTLNMSVPKETYEALLAKFPPIKQGTQGTYRYNLPMEVDNCEDFPQLREIIITIE